MGEKTELLEEKTVEELKQMARYKGFSGYSNKSKLELINLIRNHFSEGEIENWSDFGLREVGREPVTEIEEQGVNVPIVEIKTEGTPRKKEDWIHFISATGSLISWIIALILLFFYLW